LTVQAEDSSIVVSDSKDGDRIVLNTDDGEKYILTHLRPDQAENLAVVLLAFAKDMRTGRVDPPSVVAGDPTNGHGGGE
jgi:hypothetical protein